MQQSKYMCNWYKESKKELEWNDQVQATWAMAHFYVKALSQSTLKADKHIV